MHRRLRTISVILLFFLSISAIGGGIMLISDPLGAKSGMPISFLDHSPFTSFVVPGIILLVMNGLLSLIFAILIIRGNKWSAWLMILQGCILLGWLLVQLAIIKEYDWFYHTLYLAVAGSMGISGGLGLKNK
jgi:peptidoglycan/LPS O-acetylase OafA/YrhL